MHRNLLSIGAGLKKDQCKGVCVSVYYISIPALQHNAISLLLRQQLPN